MVELDWPFFEQRRFPRVKAPVLYRLPKQKSLNNPSVNMSFGGIRVYSNVYFNEGKRMEIELLLPDGNSVEVTVCVVWTNVLPPGSDASFDVGFEFLSLPPGAFNKLKDVLDMNNSVEEEVLAIN